MREATKVRIAVAGLIVIVTLSGLGLGAYLFLAQNFASDLRNGLVAACERNGNPLREGLREEKEDELREREHPDPNVLKALHLTRAQAIELAQPKIKKLKRDINVRYAPVDCVSLYPR